MHIVLSKDCEYRKVTHINTKRVWDYKTCTDLKTGDLYDVYEDVDGNIVISKQPTSVTGTIDPETKLFKPND